MTRERRPPGRAGHVELKPLPLVARTATPELAEAIKTAEIHQPGPAEPQTAGADRARRARPQNAITPGRGRTPQLSLRGSDLLHDPSTNVLRMCSPINPKRRVHTAAEEVRTGFGREIERHREKKADLRGSSGHA